MGENLKWLRERGKPKISQDDLAIALTELTGINWEQQTVSLAEQGRRPFRLVEVFMIGRIFGISPIRLLTPHEPTSDPIRFGNLDVWPDEILRDFIMEPRVGDDAAGNWRPTDPFPPPDHQAIRHWIGNLRDAVEATRDSGFDVDAYLTAAWNDHLERTRQEQQR